GDRHTRTWLRGLLPEGQIRAMIAYDLGIAGTDDFALLAALGKDCAGALSFRPAGDADDDEQISGPLTEAHIASLLRSLPTSPMGVGAGFRASLPGHQSKLLLTRVDNDWYRPDGAPSTHILKPAVRELDDSTVDNEAYCQQLATAAGLPAAITTIEQFDGVRVLTSQRFDRVRHGTHTVRIHQEDGCQAT
ncbi:MAG TPA: HipA domain-containing protein, partial [Ilumatobacteraceae bacterium]|nr:HipA domain-containing protein [Ilumatobacteraceae bacterium]